LLKNLEPKANQTNKHGNQIEIHTITRVTIL